MKNIRSGERDKWGLAMGRKRHTIEGKAHSDSNGQEKLAME
jgi:hypothetical protein